MSLMQGASYDTRHQRSRVLPCMLVSYRPLALLTRRCKTLAAVQYTRDSLRTLKTAEAVPIRRRSRQRRKKQLRDKPSRP